LSGEIDDSSEGRWDHLHSDDAAVTERDQPAVPVAVLLTVGQQLQAARLAAGMTITDVAQALKFSPRQVESLEEDNYDALPGNTIVRGFVRSYARLLKLDAEVLLTLLDARSPLAMADVRPPDNMGEATRTDGSRQLGPVMSIAIVVLLAAALLAGWHFFGPKPAKPDPAVAHTGKPAALPEPESAAPATAATAVTDASSPAAGGNAPAGTPVPELVFVLTERSWIEVTDADGRMLHSAENPAGARLVLSGKAPFDVVVGNASGVSLSYGERAIDLAPHTRAEVARLRLE